MRTAAVGGRSVAMCGCKSREGSTRNPIAAALREPVCTLSHRAGASVLWTTESSTDGTATAPQGVERERENARQTSSRSPWHRPPLLSPLHLVPLLPAERAEGGSRGGSRVAKLPRCSRELGSAAGGGLVSEATTGGRAAK